MVYPRETWTVLYNSAEIAKRSLGIQGHLVENGLSSYTESTPDQKAGIQKYKLDGFRKKNHQYKSIKVN